MSRGDGPSIPIDVRIPSVGRVHRRSGVYTMRERNALVAMLHELPKRGYLSLVVDVQAGRRTPLDVYAHYTTSTLEQLIRPTDDRPLVPLVEAWLDNALVAQSTRDRRRDVWAALKPLAGHRALLLRDLPELLQLYRGECERAETPRAFNIARTALQAFARDTVGKRKPLALAIADIPTLKERSEGRQGFALKDALEIRGQLGGDAAAVWWSMVCTGMGPGELWGSWQVHGDRVHIVGTKTDNRVRDVPLVEAPERPVLTRDGFTSALRRLSAKTGRKVTPYQGRKTFDRWMQEAGVPRVRRRQYLGHGKQDVSDKYEWYEVESYLAEDAKRMRGLLPKKGIRLAS